MITKSPKEITSIGSITLIATRTLIDLVVIILDGLGGLEEINDQQEWLSSELQDLLYTIKESQHDDLNVDVSTAFLIPT